MPRIEDKLKEMGHELPSPPSPLANYIPGYRTGNLVFLSGVGPRSTDGSMSTGKLGREFTVEQGRLHVLQCRVGKRTGVAALRIATDLVDDSDIALSRAEAVARITPDHLHQVLHAGFEDGGGTGMLDRRPLFDFSSALFECFPVFDPDVFGPVEDDRAF